MKKIVFLNVLLLVLLGCEIDRELPYHSEEAFIVVNGLICPDSLIKVRLSHSDAYPKDTDIMPQIEEAVIRLYEDDIYLGNLIYNEDKAAHYINAFPKAGSQYTIEVAVQGHELIEGTTSIPANTAISACYKLFEDTGIPFSGKIFASVDFSHVLEGEYYWLGVLSDYYKSNIFDTPPYFRYDSTTVHRKLITTLRSRSSAFDNFNSTSDGGLSNYFYYARLLETTEDVSDLNVDLFSFETTYFYPYNSMKDLAEDLGIYVVVLKSSEEYDRFLKSTILNYLNSNEESDIPNPFAEHTITYSNIKNGKGVFAGYNQQLLPLKKNSSCQ